MTIQAYVNNVLQIPVTRSGNKHTVEAIEIVLDTHEHRFYQQLSQATGKTVGQLENSIRDAKEKSLSYMEDETRQQIFRDKSSVSNTEFIILSAQFYKEKYENKEEG